MSNKFKKFIFSIGMFLIVVLMLFIIGEVFFRIFRGSPNPLIKTTQKQKQFLFEPKKDIHGVSSVEGEYDYIAHINSLGYRGAEVSSARPKDVLRVIAVGDSFTFGVGADDNETIPYNIESYLRSKSVKAEVINAGVGHSSPIMQYVNLKNIFINQEPNLVILLFDLTDLWDDWHSERMAVYDKAGEIVRFDPTFVDGKRSFWLTAVNYSAFCKYINDKIVRSFKKMKHLGLKNYSQAIKEKKRAKAAIINSGENISDETVLEYDGLLMMRGRDKKDLIDKQFVRTAKYILSIRDLLAEKGVPFILVSYPHGIYVAGDEWKDGRVTWGFEAGKTYDDYYAFELLANFANENKINFINTLPYFLENKKEGVKYFFDFDGHMMPAGYKMVADGVINNNVFKGVIKRFMPYIDLE